jgi:dUTP pyrophosphatase
MKKSTIEMELGNIKEVKGNDLYFAKVRPTAKIPTKDDENMGYDIYADFKEDYILIQPHETKMIPTGICSAFSKKYGISLRERGTNGVKGIKVSAGQIDSGYRGEWFVAWTNTNVKDVVLTKDVESWNEAFYIIYPYEKAIAQAKVEIVPQVEIVETTVLDIMQIESERGVGKLGSSSK